MLYDNNTSNTVILRSEATKNLSFEYVISFLISSVY